MAGEYWDAGYFKKTKNDKTFFVKCGSAKQNEDGSFRVYLDAYPLPGEYGVVLDIKPQRERSGGSRPASSSSDDAPW